MSEVTLESQLIDIIKDEDMAENIKLAKIDMLIKLGVDVNARGSSNHSALNWASLFGHKEIVELLIQNGADVNQKDNESQNAMMVAYDNETKKAIMDAVKKRNEKENGGSFFSKIKKRIRGR